MLCARCGTEKGIKEFKDELLCPYCYNIKTTTDNIVNTNDRYKTEKLLESIYDKGFNDGYRQSIYDDYGC